MTSALGILSPHLFRFDGPGHKVVIVHCPDPLADGGAGFGDLGDVSGSEVFVVDVGLDLGDHRFRDVVLGRGRKGGGEGRGERGEG